MKIFKNKENLLILVLSLVLVATLTIGKVVADTISAADIPMKDNSSTTIKSRLDALASKSRPTACPSNAICEWKKSWANVAKGDYVMMTPNPSGLDSQNRYTIAGSETGYYTNSTTKALVDQYIYPKELTLWRVIKVYKDENNETIVDMVSEYVSSTKVYFKGEIGYAKYIQTLNTIAKQYENSTYTSGSRYMGYNGQTTPITNTAAFNGTSNSAPWTSSTTSTANQKPSNESLGGGDTLYTTDTNLVTTAVGNLKAKKCGNSTCSSIGSETAYWLASRRYNYGSSTVFSFHGRYVNTSGSISNSSIRYYNSGWSDYSSSYALRPIVTLKSGLSVSDAVGSSTDPFVIG